MNAGVPRADWSQSIPLSGRQWLFSYTPWSGFGKKESHYSLHNLPKTLLTHVGADTECPR